MIEASPDTDPQVQSLAISLRKHGLLGGGASFPVSPKQRALQTGVVVFSGSGCERHRCSPIFSAGIAGPATAYMTLAPAPQSTARRRRVRRRIAVVQGFFVFTVPRDSGPEVLTGRARNGRELSVSFLPPRGPVPGVRLREERHSAPTE